MKFNFAKSFGLLWFLPFVGFLIGYFLIGHFLQKNDFAAPNLIGKNLYDSIQIVSKNRLGIRLMNQREDQTMPEGIVLDQFPRPDQKIRPNQNIFVTLSTRQRSVTMPDVWGKKQKEAIDLLAQKSLEAQVLRLNSTYAKGMIMAQIPAAGQPLVTKKTMLFVSSGAPTLSIMPSFKGHKLSAVSSVLQNLDVRAELVHIKPQAPEHVCNDCVVVDQQPVPGSIVDLAGSIHIQLQMQ